MAADEIVKLGDQVVHDEGLVLGRGRREGRKLFLDLAGLVPNFLDDIWESKGERQYFGVEYRGQSKIKLAVF